jgi:hypothetical protein
MKFTTTTATALVTFIGAAPIAAFHSKGGKSSFSYTAKSGKGSKSKSSKSECTYCSAETLTRAELRTELTTKMFAAEDGILNSAQILDAVEDPEFDAYLSTGTVENIAGCLIYADCFVHNLLLDAENNANSTITASKFLMVAINTLCEAERLGERLPEGGSNITSAPSISMSLSF